MFRFESPRVAARLATVAAAFIALLALVAASDARGGNGGVGDDTAPTDPADPATPTDGVFPVPAKHRYGDGFGAGRDHQGQDLLSKCGKPILSAQSGRVQKVAYHSAAGNYVVIDGRGALEDLVYAHLQKRPALKRRQLISAGDKIGRVGDTGNASTCHLHFEMWSNPGYYEGGSAIDPTPALRAWDKKR